MFVQFQITNVLTYFEIKTGYQDGRQNGRHCVNKRFWHRLRNIHDGNLGDLG